MHLVIVDTKNRRGKTDGDEFRREADAFAKTCDGDVSRLYLHAGDSAKNDKQLRESVLDFINGEVGVQSVSFFCHGWQTGISAGFRTRRGLVVTDEIEQLARAISRACNGTVVIRLFACLTGRGKYWWWKKRSIWGLRDRPKNIDDRIMYGDAQWRDGFAMMLCEGLQRQGVESVIFANLTSGHTTRNPHRVIIESKLRDVEAAGFAVPYIERSRITGNGPRWRRWFKSLINGTDDVRRFYPERWPINV